MAYTWPMLHSGDRIERYVIDAPIGEGGLAKVYRVHHMDLGSVHALKVLQQTGERFRQRMLEEGRIQVRLRHPNVVAVTDMVRYQGAPCLVMEYVRGIPLDLYLDEVGPFSLPLLDRVADDMLRGLGEAHLHGTIHRDLKPSNVMFAVQPDGIFAKVADFGLGKVLSDGGLETRTNVSLGTPAYMAPEQIRDAKNVDQRADVYAVAALLYELLTGHRAFPQNDLIDRYHASRDGSWTPSEQFRPEAPARMHNALRAAMAYNVNERPQNALELLELWQGGSELPLPPRDEVLDAEVRSTIERLRASHQTETGVGAPPREFAAAGSETATPLLQTPVQDPRVQVPAVASEVSSRRYPPPAPPKPSRLPAITAGIALCAALLALYALFRPKPEPVAVQEPVEVADVRLEGPATVPVPAQPETPEAAPPGPSSAGVAPTTEPEPAQVEERQPRATNPTPVASVAASTPKPRPVAPPEPEKPSTGTVSVSGAARASLVGADGTTHEPGTVPEGSYTVRVWFEGGEPIDALTVDVAGGSAHEVFCDDLLFMCRAK